MSNCCALFACNVFATVHTHTHTLTSLHISVGRNSARTFCTDLYCSAEQKTKKIYEPKNAAKYDTCNIWLAWHTRTLVCLYDGRVWLCYVQHMPLFVTQIFWQLFPTFEQVLSNTHTHANTNMNLRSRRGSAQRPQLVADVSTSPITGTCVNTVISVGFQRAHSHTHMYTHTHTDLFAFTFAFAFPFWVCCPSVSVAVALAISIYTPHSPSTPPPFSLCTSISFSICSSKYYFVLLLLLLLFAAKL